MFRKSPVMLEVLSKKALSQYNKELNLFIDVKTKWDRLYKICVRHYEIKEVVFSALSKFGENSLDLSEREKQ